MDNRLLTRRFRFIAPVCGILFLLAGCTTTQVVEHPIDDKVLGEKVLKLIRENPKVMLEAITAYQVETEKAQQQAQEEALKKTIATLDLATLVGESPTRGASDRRVLFVEFSDFQCPFCGRAQDTLKAFMAKHGTEVTMVYKHLPLTQLHPEAVAAGRAAWAAHQQGKFWEYHDLLFAGQKDLGDKFYDQTAKALKLDLKRFKRDRTSDASLDALKKDVALADQLGLQGTPYFLLNHEPVSGAVPLAEFEAALRKAQAALQALQVKK